MNWLSVVKSPLIGLFLFFLGICFCAWQLEKAARRLGIDEATDEDPPKNAAMHVAILRMLFAFALSLATLYILHKTTFLVAFVFVATGCAYLWFITYKSRVRPLIQAGLPKTEAWYLTAIQAFWIMPLAIAVTFHLWGKYGAL